MPQIVSAVVAKSAMAAPATTTALELAKQQAIQESMRQMAAQSAKQATLETAKQAGIEAAKKAGAEATRQGIMQGADGAASSAYYNPASTPSPYGAPTPPATAPAPAAPLNPAGAPPNLDALKMQTIQSGSPSVTPSLDTLKTRAFQSGSPLAPESKLLAEQAARAPSNIADSLASGEKLVTQQAQTNLSPLQKGIDQGLKLVKEGAGKALDLVNKYPMEIGMGALTLGQSMNQSGEGEDKDKDKYKSSVDMSDFKPSIASVAPFKPSYEYQKYAAEGGLMKYAVGGPVETMAAMNAVGANLMYPQAGLQTPMYSNPSVQRPESINVIAPSSGPAVGTYTGEQRFADGGISEEMAKEYGLKTRKQRAIKSLTKDYEEMEKERAKEAEALMSSRPDPGIIRRSRTQELSSPFSAAMAEHARLAKKNKVPVAEMPKTSLGDIDNYMDTPVEAAGGGIMHGLGGYSDGGRLLRGPGDGVSDSIPAVIGKRQPARLADGEFVIPARIVSELGNGSTEAGARKLYAMMERVQKSRKKSIGKKKVAVNSKADKHLPA
jgi:hypothetical protein